MILFFAMVLGIGFVNRNLVFEQRASANQYRSTQAFEAAEAGLEWAIAQLDHAQRIDADCLPSTAPAATSFRSRYLAWDPTTARFVATTWLDAGTAAPLQPACVRSDAGWSCSCPSNGAANLVASASAASAPAPAFTVKFQNVPQAGVVRVIAIGCTSLGGACQPGGGTTTDATTRIEVLVGLVAALRTPPAAPLTVRGTVGADATGLGVHHRDADSGALVIHAGGSVAALPARSTVPAGSPMLTAIADNDAALAALTPKRFFASWFGIDRETWAASPMVHRLACTGDCTAAIVAAIAGDGEASLIFIDGGVQLSGPVVLGSPQRPVAIVASGTVQLGGAVTLHGLLYGSDVAWTGAGTNGTLVRGAVLSEGDYHGNASPDLVYDAAVLARLKTQAGLFARIPGSWKDF